jgi:hypothetical protein
LAGRRGFTLAHACVLVFPSPGHPPEKFVDLPRRFL